jgi:hypothetical protein
MFQGLQPPGCSRFGMTDAFVPFQPNVNSDGSLNARAGRDDAILYGAVVQDPGGLPLGTILRTDVSSFLNAPGAPFDVTIRAASGKGRLARGEVALTVPAGWEVDDATKAIGPIVVGRESRVTFRVTPAADATPNQNYKIQADLTTGRATGHTETVVRVVPGVQGRFARWGKWAEYDSWLANTAPRAQRVGYSAAVRSIAVGETVTVPVRVHNYSTSPQTGEVQLTLPAGLTADAAAKSYGTLAPGADATVEFQVSNSFTNATLPAGNQDATIATTQDAPAGSSSETLTLQVVPSTTVPKAPAAPAVDGQEGTGEYTGEALDVGRRWEGTECAPLGVDCGTTGTVGDPATSTYAKVTHADDALYLFVHVRDDFQSYAVTPRECVAHWLADSVEIQIDPRGNSSETNMETAATFKLGVFPFTNDPTGSNGNGPNGPCWSRDADNHQGYSTGPLAATVAQAPNAPGVEVASSATWVGTNETTTDHAYEGGGYSLEVKIPMADLPAAIDPDRMALNITPYDNDNNAAEGTTTLRHIDQGQTRVAWSAFGSVQSNPYLWGRARLADYTPPADRPTEPSAPIISSSNLNGAESPQTIAQSARDGVPISGRTPAARSEQLAVPRVKFNGDRTLQLRLFAQGPGIARIFLWSGEKGFIPVYTSSCDPQDEPAASRGLSACAITDGGIPPWGEDMSGRVLARQDVRFSRKGTKWQSIRLDAGQRAQLERNGSVLVSWETPDGHVQALDLPLANGRRAARR